MDTLKEGEISFKEEEEAHAKGCMIYLRYLKELMTMLIWLICLVTIEFQLHSMWLTLVRTKPTITLQIRGSNLFNKGRMMESP